MKKVNLVAAACLLVSTSAQAQGWVNVSDPNITPGGTNDAPMCYDGNIQKVVLLQGDDTWAYDINGWTQITTATQPVVNVSSNNTTCGGQPVTAQYNGYSVMAYNPARSGITLLRRARLYQNGQYPSSCYRIYQFFFDGQDWIHEGVAFSSSAGNRPLLAYEPNAGKLFAYWNENGNGFYAMDQQGAWQPVTGSLVSPPNITGDRDILLFDNASQRIKFLQRGGSGSAYYEYDSSNGQWYQCFPSSYPGPITPSNPYNLSTLNGVASGPIKGIGLYKSGPFTLATAAFSGCDIETLFLPINPSYRTGSSVAYDQQRDVYIMHGGGGYADTWELTLGPGASYSTSGTGCTGTGGTPTLQAANGSLPVAGSQFNVQVSGMPWNTFAFMFLGAQNTSYAGTPLPFDLAPVGAPGCVLRAPGTFLFGVPNVLGTGLWTYTVPYQPGQVLYHQAIIFDPAANALGITVSNLGEATIGS